MKNNSYINLSKTGYGAVDIAKFFSSILVVALHVLPLGTMSVFAHANFLIQSYAARLAVPLFFISTGFFLFNKQAKDNLNGKMVFASAFRMLKLYLVWSAIYLPIRFYDNVVLRGNPILLEIVKYIRDFLFSGSYLHLWYLKASFWGIVLTYYFLKKGFRVKTILLISFGFYFIGLFGQTWYGFLTPLKVNAPHIWVFFAFMSKIVCTTRNGLFEGFLFISIGMSFAFAPPKIRMPKAIIGLMVSMLFFYCEAKLVAYYEFSLANDMYLFLVPSSYFLFFIIFNLPVTRSETCIKLKQISGFIYYLHPLILFAISRVAEGLRWEIGKTCILFILIVVTTMICSIIIIKLSRYPQFKWLIHIYS